MLEQHDNNTMEPVYLVKFKNSLSRIRNLSGVWSFPQQKGSKWEGSPAGDGVRGKV